MISIYTPNIEATQYIRQMLTTIKGEIDSNTIIVGDLNAPTKRQRLAEWIQKQDPSICCLQETHLKMRDTYTLKVKG